MRDAIRRVAVALVILAGLAPASALARHRNVLVLDTGAPGRPLAAALMGAFRETLAGTPDDPISIYEEALDLERFSDEANAARLRASWPRSTANARPT
ncbi:MAG TPA: hypothetical protein VE359_15620 [Vicinamibacteria bacterium]|nr:hypothetical protein [Vicinamibacteria bacterium]